MTLIPKSPDSLSILLDRYYQADERAAPRLEHELLTEISGSVRKQIALERFTREDAEDLHVWVMKEIAEELQNGRQSSRKRVNSLPAWRYIIVTNLIREQRRANTPRRIMYQSLLHTVNRSAHKDLFARWVYGNDLLIGLTSWYGESRAETERYRLFCQDSDPFIQQALDGRDPAVPGRISLWELLYKLLEWVRTPVEQSLLIDHLLILQPIKPLDTIPLGDIPPTMEPRRIDRYAFLETDFDWDRCWKAIQSLTPKQKSTLLLVLEPKQLVLLTAQGDPRPLLAEELQLDPDEIQQIWAQLPLSDEEIALQFKTDRNNVQRMRCYARQRIRNSMHRTE